MIGYIQRFGEHFTTPGNDAPMRVSALAPGAILNGYDAIWYPGGERHEVHMQQTNWGVVSGVRQYTFLDDFYFRIYLIPDVLDYGTFSADTTIRMRVWNAYFGRADLLSVVPMFGDEVRLDEAADLPLTFGGLQYRTLGFTADGDGATVLSDQFTFTFDTDDFVHDVLRAQVLGFRIPSLTDLTWPFKTNWESGYEIEYVFQTDIITSENGTEQRIQVRQTPRKSISLSILLDDERRKEFQRLLTSTQKGRFFVPELPRFVETTAPMAAGDTETFIDEAAPWWMMERDAHVLLIYRNQMSVRKMDTPGLDSNSDPNFVTFRDDDDFEWPAGTRIHPALSCWMADDIPGVQHTNLVWTSSVRFLARPGIEPREPIMPPAEVFDGRELWLNKPNYANPPALNFVQPTVFVDAGSGRIERETDIEHQSTRMVLTYVGKDFEAAEILRQFFFRCAGRQKEFYMPTWQPDITLREGFVASDTRLPIDGIRFASIYSDDPVRKGAPIAIYFTDGTVLYKNVRDIYAAEDSNDEPASFLDFQEPIGQDRTLEEIVQVSWVPLWRHSTDSLTVRYHTNSVCEMSFTVQQQPWFPADNMDSNS